MAVNLHPTILTMLEEAKWMRRLGLKIPEKFHTLNMANVKKTYDQLKVSVCVCVCVCVYVSSIKCLYSSIVYTALQYLLEEKCRVWESIPSVFTPLMKYHLNKVSTCLSTVGLCVCAHTPSHRYFKVYCVY